MVRILKKLKTIIAGSRTRPTTCNFTSAGSSGLLIYVEISYSKRVMIFEMKKLATLFITLPLLLIFSGCASQSLMFRLPSNASLEDPKEPYSKISADRLMEIDMGTIHLSLAEVSDSLSYLQNSLAALSIDSEIVLTDLPTFSQKPLLHIKPGSGSYFSKLANSLESKDFGFQSYLLLDPIDQNIRSGLRASFRADGRLIISFPKSLTSQIALKGHPIINHELAHLKSYVAVNQGAISCASRSYISIRKPIYAGIEAAVAGGGSYNKGFNVDEINAFALELDEYLNEFNGASTEKLNANFQNFSNRLNGFSWFVFAGINAVEEFKSSSNKIKIEMAKENPLFSTNGKVTYAASTEGFDLYFTDIEKLNHDQLASKVSKIVNALDLFFTNLKPKYEALNKDWIPIWGRITEMNLDDTPRTAFKPEEIISLKAKLKDIQFVVQQLRH